MQVNDIALGKECSTWNNGSLRGKLVIIDKASGSSYSVTGVDGFGGGAWLTDNDLEFVKHGTQEERESVEQKGREITAKQTDLVWIRDNWKELDGISANSILTLLHAIGYHSSFEKNGEYFILAEDWNAFYPVFEAIMSKSHDDAIASVRKIVKPQYADKYENAVDDLYCMLNA